MHPCWEGEGGNRPTFSKLESILGEYLGEQGIQKFKVRFKFLSVRYLISSDLPWIKRHIRLTFLGFNFRFQFGPFLFY